MSDIANFLYTKTSNRIRRHWEECDRPLHEGIVKNRKLFSLAINCKLTDDNPYLLTKTSVEGIRRNLKFDDNTELMFGDKEEIASYTEELFFMFFDEYVEDCSLFYCDYLPYSKVHTLIDLLSEKGLRRRNKEFRETLFGSTKKELTKQLDSLTEKARRFVYQKNKEWFGQELNRFIKETTSFKMLPKKIDKFARDVFLNRMNENIPTSKDSLGIRAKELLENDLAIVDQEIRVFNWQDPKEEYNYRVFSASMAYLKNLEKIYKD